MNGSTADRLDSRRRRTVFSSLQLAIPDSRVQNHHAGPAGFNCPITDYRSVIAICLEFCCITIRLNSQNQESRVIDEAHPDKDGLFFLAIDYRITAHVYPPSL